MKQIVVFGAGKSSSVLINFLKELSRKRNWNVTIADGNLINAQSKTGNHEFVKPIEINIENVEERNKLIEKADLVISLMPPHLHFLVAQSCLEFSKNLLTASYIDDQTKILEEEIKNKNLLFLYEMGLDPGIDHMSAMQIINHIKEKGGKIVSFKSHCGGLVATESDDNPWHYKISWNPKNVVMAGKAGATYLENGEETTKEYQELFNPNNKVVLPKGEEFCFYPNRDSLGYIPIYELNDIKHFERTTLRDAEFCFGWKKIVDLQLTNEEKIYETDGLSIANFFSIHFKKYNLENWLIHIEDEEEKKLAATQFDYLGLNDFDTVINLGICSAAEVLQFILEKKLILNDTDKDLIVMMHEFEYVENNKTKYLKSVLKVKGENKINTAMAKTVGLPLGIAAELILDGVITETGLRIPIIPNIYTPVLEKLKQYNIIFDEFETIIND